MKSIYFLLPLLGSVFASGNYYTTKKCVAACPKFNCDSTDAAILCQCQNDRETACKKLCPTYKPAYQACPVTPPAPTCECDPVFCVQSFPESCYCANAAKTSCYKKCGGPKPVYQTCPPRTTLTLTRTRTSTSTRYNAATPTPTKNTTPPLFYPAATPPPAAKPTNQICGGGRAGATLDCPAGYACIADPFLPGSCGPACDQLGVCAEDKLCGGFAGFRCQDADKVCVDDPRDGCGLLNGGADCGGLCVYPVEEEVV